MRDPTTSEAVGQERPAWTKWPAIPTEGGRFRHRGCEDEFLQDRYGDPDWEPLHLIFMPPQDGGDPVEQSDCVNAARCEWTDEAGRQLVQTVARTTRDSRLAAAVAANTAASTAEAWRLFWLDWRSQCKIKSIDPEEGKVPCQT
jgi:hypothetical protein